LTDYPEAPGFVLNVVQ
jgi:hypothetical protein